MPPSGLEPWTFLMEQAHSTQNCPSPQIAIPNYSPWQTFVNRAALPDFVKINEYDGIRRERRRLNAV